MAADAARSGKTASDGGGVNIKDFVRVLRARWISIVAAVILGFGGAVAMTMQMTPQYEASTRLFVSTTATPDGVSDVWQGAQYSQQRVQSYTELLTGEALAQRTVDRLRLNISAKALTERIEASSAPESVVLDVSVRDSTPTGARDIANALTDEFVSMATELETAKNGSEPDARVVVQQRAALPTDPVSPNPALNLGVGLALGLLCGLGLAILRDRLDTTVKSREIVEEITGTGLLGNIPFDKKRKKEAAISFKEDRSRIAEAVRAFRTNLQFLDVDETPRVYVLTSCLEAEGKTTTALNLALALAEAEHSVVIVDGDMRNPTLHRYLGLMQSVGLSTVLGGQETLDVALQGTRFSGLTGLTAGDNPSNPSELLGSRAGQKLLNDLRTRFDYVVVDSPALLEVTDAAILAAEADGVVVVVRFGETTREQLAHAVGNLKNVGARILGAVLTMTPARGITSYSYNYYGVHRAPSGSRGNANRSAARDKFRTVG
jgi:capsular exopolysaccharide synthesis family protein